ncbi:transporter substrate-binding domain-containing protein [Bordetella sp. FB-8]|uniref:transporter substrate-binding domain-containing protein n=1 Tax=Bordetella sp. FB-8 TaxID=1159870 RepID=UPI00037ACBE7|nr:transporter substrate-binding domain-containing protein [Bordetella sp. FB-8]
MRRPKHLVAACAAVISLTLLGGTARAQDALARAQAAGVLHIATEEQFPPYDFIQDGKHAGFNVDLFAQIGHKLGLKIDWIDRPWPRIMLGLQSRKFDLAGGPAPITADLAKTFRFLPPVSSAQTMIEIRKGETGLVKPADIAGKKIGAQRGSFALAELRRFNTTLPRPVAIVEYADNRLANADLKAGRLDGVAIAANDVMEVLRHSPGVFGVVQPGFGTRVYYGYMMRDDGDSRSLFEAISNAMRELTQQGKLAELQTKWFGQAITVPAKAPKPEQ